MIFSMLISIYRRSCHLAGSLREVVPRSILARTPHGRGLSHAVGLLTLVYSELSELVLQAFTLYQR